MRPLKTSKRQKPERDLQNSIIEKLRAQEWLVKETHGNMFQAGFPDLYCAHAQYGARWIECKNADSYKFTPAQHLWFPQFAAAGIGIWIVTRLDQVPDILFKAPNWYMYLKVMN